MPITALRDLSTLQRSLKSQYVLSVYFTAKATNPSQRNEWRARLKSELRRLEQSLDNADADERREFRAAREAIGALDAPALKQSEGVACFATASGVQRVADLPFAVETTAAWGKGVALAALMRARRAERTVILAVADGKTADLYSYLNGRLETLESLHVEPHLRQPTHMSARVTVRFHPGTRGVAGQDEAQREWSAATERLARRAADQIAHHAGDTAWVVLGGRPDVVHQIQHALPKGAQHRCSVAPGVTLRAQRRQLQRVVAEAASAMRNDADARALQHLADGGDERHGVALGENAARRALDSSSVSRLYISPRFVSENAARAESAVRAAIEQGADIETVSGGPAATLDAMGGIAARLRYALP